MDSILGSLFATITIAFLYYMFRKNSLPILKKNKLQLLSVAVPTIIFCIFFPKVVKIAIIFLVVEIVLYIIDFSTKKKNSEK